MPASCRVRHVLSATILANAKSEGGPLVLKDSRADKPTRSSIGSCLPSEPEALLEIEGIEDDDAFHDFGGAESNKGNDFAHFWLICRVLEAEETGEDYMFVCEYAQDVAEFNSSSVPDQVILYQLKKHETGYWPLAALTGQTDKSKTPKAERPLVKLYRSVRAFDTLRARGVFVSHMAFDIPLQTGEMSTKYDSISLAALKSAHFEALRAGLSALTGAKLEDIDLDALELRRVALEVNDLERHTTGIVYAFLSKRAPDHANQAASLVDTMYLRIRSCSRQTNKSTTWVELIEKRGFGKRAFVAAIQALETIPLRIEERETLLTKLANNLTWRAAETIRVRMAMADFARNKVLTGEAAPWVVDRGPLHSLFYEAETLNMSDEDCFARVKELLTTQLPDLSNSQISALAIYEMIDAWTRPAPILV